MLFVQLQYSEADRRRWAAEDAAEDAADDAAGFTDPMSQAKPYGPTRGSINRS